MTTEQRIAELQKPKPGSVIDRQHKRIHHLLQMTGRHPSVLDLPEDEMLELLSECFPSTHPSEFVKSGVELFGVMFIYERP